MTQTPKDNLDALLLVVTTMPNEGSAEALAKALVEARLAACVQMQPGMTSIYRWEGKVCEESEVLLSAKTMQAKWLEICAFIQKAHPYDIPEILAFSPEQYDQQYGKWLQSEVNSKS